MDKKQFLAQFPGEDPIVLARLHTLIEAAFAGRRVVSGEFYTPAIWSQLTALPGALPPDGGFYDLFDADRRLFACPLEMAPAGVRVAEVTNRYPARTLAHKDYLGALMNLGIRREKFSDLVLVDDRCLIPMVPEILLFVLDNLTKVGNNGVSTREADLAELLTLPRQYAERTVLVASLRLDGVAENDPQRLSEKWEAMDLLRALDPEHPDDWLLLVGNDNDFIARRCVMQGETCDSPLDNDNRVLVYRLTLPAN